MLGLLPPNQARALEALALSDAAVAASVTAWEDRLAPLADLVPPLPPPPALWRRLALAAGLDDATSPGRGASRALWRSLGLWRTAAAGAAAIAAGLAVLLYAQPARRAEPLLAALTPFNAPGATFLVRVGPDGMATVVAVTDASVPQGRSLQLWAVRAGADAPVSLGLLPGSGRARLPIPPAPGTQLLISQEPLGGSPTNLPTGPVVYSGLLTAL